ncbi:hypothetical protein GCM10008938_07870 [Deinococcus roseus]|uniref:Transposase n=1 Tax=Deinococcus roseus TaxID=392414 RepID=A0ABQ2CV78_9DEIO|nr:hypothetical protein GCM10008938_07870 [Deinococcus roseus]
MVFRKKAPVWSLLVMAVAVVGLWPAYLSSKDGGDNTSIHLSTLVILFCMIDAVTRFSKKKPQ